MRFLLTSSPSGEPVRVFEARNDELAVENCKGYLEATVANSAGASEAVFRLEEDKVGLADDAKHVGTVRLVPNGVQQWHVVHRRYLKSSVDMSVGDPHDEPPAPPSQTSSGSDWPVRKQSRAASRRATIG